ncbi:50S ribosomal protein L29 [Elongatibacter sediminis]|uniref:Large ribosomal subunit protein uL29 n=1 Tax=Elongatibacter sediminis TaxID=3119006 RepID=A0AAW9RBM8_9GAMM
MDAQELRSKSESDLREQLSGLLKEQFSLRMQKGTGQLVTPHELRRVRRDIARVKTVLNEKSSKGNAA